MYAGIDFDTHAVHVVLLPEEGLADYYRYELMGADAFERTRQVRDAMPPRTWWTDEGVIGAFIEEPAGKQTGYQFRVQGAILACLPPSLLVEKFMPSQWRKMVELKGNASKEEVAAFVMERRMNERSMENRGTCQEPLWEWAAMPDWPQDACDAYCLAMCAEMLTEPLAA